MTEADLTLSIVVLLILGAVYALILALGGDIARQREEDDD